MDACVIYNPKAGSAEQMALLLKQIRARPATALCETRSPDDVRRETLAALDRGLRLIVAAGGDGTIHVVVNALMSRARRKPRPDVTFGLIPLGTGNDLARTLAIPPQPSDALRLLDTGEVRAIDLMRVRVGDRTTYGHNVAAGGFTGQMNEAMTDQIKQTWGPLAYVRGAIKVLPDLTKYHTTLRLGGKAPRPVPALNIIVANGRTAGGGTVVAPRANPEDGLLDVVVVRTGTMLELTGVAARLLAGDYTTSDLVTHERATRVEVESQPGMWFNVDGELLTNQRLVFGVVPKALRVVVGPDYRAEG